MTRVKVSGLKELDRALGELPRATARTVLRRVLKKAGQPIADAMAALAPDDPATPPIPKRKLGKNDQPNIDLRHSIRVSPRISNETGKAAYAGVMRAGGTKADAVAALRTARRSTRADASTAEMHVGPLAGRNSHVGALREFGTAETAAHPWARPAWEQQKDEALAIVRRDLGAEIDKAAKRLAVKAAGK